MEEKKLYVVAQKADPEAVIVKGQRGGFATTVINVLEDGSERKYRLSSDRKKDLLVTLQKLPVDNVKGMWIDLKFGGTLLELFSYNGV